MPREFNRHSAPRPQGLEDAVSQLKAAVVDGDVRTVGGKEEAVEPDVGCCRLSHVHSTEERWGVQPRGKRDAPLKQNTTRGAAACGGAALDLFATDQLPDPGGRALPTANDSAGAIVRPKMFLKGGAGRRGKKRRLLEEKEQPPPYAGPSACRCLRWCLCSSLGSRSSLTHVAFARTRSRLGLHRADRRSALW